MSDNPLESKDQSGGGGFRAFWSRHRHLFWTLHSLWALATGVFVVWLARERYAFVPWVVLFLALTWASTMFFGRRIPDSPREEEGSPRVPGLGEEATSYLTRTMYQETLFFLLPFYAYSTVVGSVNMVFLLGLGALAFVSCLDLVFDRWLRTSPVASVAFFAIVAFAALNLLLPILMPLAPIWSTRIAVVAAIVSAVPLAAGSISWTTGVKARVGGAALVFVAVALGFPQLVPPVPLRLDSATFSRDIERSTLEPIQTFTGRARLTDLDGAVVVLMEVFAPTVVPTRVAMVWERNGTVIRESREIEILAHDLGFRVWDAWRPTDAPLEAGEYEVVLRTAAGRMFGRASIEVLDS
ncbi:MAG: hypothetical protein HKN72_16570 [Gemmatimonadetes bacterium]|nr:hypothetical protein [Gemmatimonadota bacterium]